MDKLIHEQKIKSEIQEINALANALVILEKAIVKHIIDLESGNKSSELIVPPLCRMMMNFAGIQNVHMFFESLCSDLINSSNRILLSNLSTPALSVIVRSYKGNDIDLLTWTSEILDLSSKMREWHKDATKRITAAKIK